MLYSVSWSARGTVVLVHCSAKNICTVFANICLAINNSVIIDSVINFRAINKIGMAKAVSDLQRVH
eukprot:5415508-Lingulodinium_polyedra.AAC.1